MTTVTVLRSEQDEAAESLPIPFAGGGDNHAVLDWIRQIDESSPLLEALPGVSTTESRRLARLGELVRSQLGSQHPAIADRLRVLPRIEVPRSVAEGFGRLCAVDAVVALANLYAEIVSSAHRRPLGTFFTPREEAKSMVQSFASRHAQPTNVIDVGAGVGIFSVAAREQWPTAAIKAIDVNPVTLGLQAAALGPRNDPHMTLELADYTNWLNQFSPDGRTLYLGNPPYTRWQLIDAAQRESLLDAAHGLVGVRANLSTLFLGATIKKLRPEDSLCMIVPAGWMRADYSKELRRFLRKASNRRVNLRLADSWRFDNAIVDAVVVEIGPEEELAQPIELSSWSQEVSIRIDRESDELSPFPSLGPTKLPTRQNAGPTKKLRELARITRGTATGANQFFVMNETQASVSEIPTEWFHTIVRRLRPGHTGAAPMVELSRLLVLKHYSRGQDAKIDALINAGETDGIDQGHLCSRRDPWFDLTAEVQKPDVVLSALGRDRFHIFENPNGYAITNNLFALVWTTGLEQHTKEATLEWLRGVDGQLALLMSSSTEANALHRLSPRAIGEIDVPLQSAPSSTTSTLDSQRKRSRGSDDG
jgi:predicted RNA methylase